MMRLYRAPALSIRDRLLVVIGVLVLTICVFQILYFPARFRQHGLDGLTAKAVAMVQLVVYSAGPEVPTRADTALERAVEGAAHDGDLAYIQVYDLEGEPVHGWSGRGVAPPARLVWPGTLHIAFDRDRVVVTSPMPIGRTDHGAVQAAFLTHDIAASARDNLLATMGVSLLTILLALFVAQRLGSSLRQRMGLIADVAQQMAEGNLDQRLLGDTYPDEIGALATAFNDLLHSQQLLVRQIHVTARQIKATSNDILGAARQQELGATEQSSAVEETRHTMESLVHSGHQIGTSAHVVLNNAERTQTNNQLISERITALSAHVERITEILEVIKDIANKSEMLALNASLEGTKAGEAGRGFSLVASQMQRLAENVMGAVRDIKTLTDDVREATQASVMSTEDGTKLAADTTRSAQQISLIIAQQVTGTEQVTRAMDDVAHIAQQTAGASRQSVRTTKALTELSDQLDVLVGQFQLDHPR